MLQAFIITLREGVEAALIVGIVLAYLDKIGRADLRKSVFAALASAFAGSLGVAIILSRTQFNQDIFEGWVMLAAAVFVVSMIVFMQRTAHRLKGHIEGRIGDLAGGSSSFGIFLFVFLMVLREGVETVLILSAVTLNSTELMSFMGTLAGVIVAIVFGVMFVKGSIRIHLPRFFKVTSVILYFVAFQLIISGLHELSENGVLPSSRREMTLVGPIVRNDLFFFITILALAALMVLFEYKRRASVPEEAESRAAQRKAQWTVQRERLWMASVYVSCFLFIFMATAQVIYAHSTTALSNAAPVELRDGLATIPLSQVSDGDLHRYVTSIGSQEVRFLLVKKPDGNVVAVLDACQICGPVGFYKNGNNLICKNCSSPVNIQSVGQPGGCNPIPLQARISGDQVVIAAADLGQAARILNNPMFLQLLFQSFRRQQRRKLLAGVAVGLGMSVVTAMIVVGADVGDKMNRELQAYGANILIYPEQDSLDLQTAGVDLKPVSDGSYLRESDLPKLKSIFWHNNILGFAPFLPMSVSLQAGSAGAPIQAQLIGTYFNHRIEFGDDSLTTGVLKTHPWWRIEGVWPKDDSSDVLVGQTLAQRLGIGPGSNILIDGKNTLVSGLLSTGAEEDQALVGPLHFVQGLAGRPDAVRRVYVSALTKPEDALARRNPDTLSGPMRDRWYCSPYANSIAYQIQEAIPHVRAEQIRRVAQNEGRILSRISGLMWLVAIAAVLAAALAVSSAMTTTIHERRREIGLMKSLGATRGGIAALFLAEGAVLAVAAGLAGFLVGAIVARQLGKTIFGSAIAVDPALLPIVLFAAVLITAAGSALSIRRASRLDPAVILRGDA